MAAGQSKSSNIQSVVSRIHAAEELISFADTASDWGGAESRGPLFEETCHMGITSSTTAYHSTLCLVNSQDRSWIIIAVSEASLLRSRCISLMISQEILMVAYSLNSRLFDSDFLPSWAFAISPSNVTFYLTRILTSHLSSNRRLLRWTAWKSVRRRVHDAFSVTSVLLSTEGVKKVLDQ